MNKIELKQVLDEVLKRRNIKWEDKVYNIENDVDFWINIKEVGDKEISIINVRETFKDMFDFIIKLMDDEEVIFIEIMDNIENDIIWVKGEDDE